MKDGKKVGLALGGGGARGFCHIGVLEVLQENNIPVDVITGCSMGALVGGLAAAGVEVVGMRQMAESIGPRKVFDIDINIFNAFKSGLAKGNKAIKMYKGLGGDKLIEECKIPFAAIATDLASGKLHVFKSGPMDGAVRASMSIPGVFQPVRIDGKVLVDGGVLKRLPISEAKDLGADVVIAVDALGAPTEEPNIESVFKIIEKAYLTLDWKTAQNEYKHADINIIPDMGSKSLYIFKENIKAIEAGRAAAIQALPQIIKLLKKKKILPKR